MGFLQGFWWFHLVHVRPAKTTNREVGVVNRLINQNEKHILYPCFFVLGCHVQERCKILLGKFEFESHDLYQNCSVIPS